MKKPNFIVFLADDQGYGDLSCMGTEDFKTPHLDQMSEDGARFSSWYSNSSVCSPARASLLTGRYPGNAGVRAILAGHRTATGLPPQAHTIATALREQCGYNTYMSGKWHLGLNDGSRPGSHGFDHWFGHLAGCIDYFSHIFYWGMNKPGPGLNPTHDMWEDDEEIWDNGKYFTELIAEKAIEYLRDAAAAGKPFFLYVPFNAPHYPMHAPQKYLDRFPDLPEDRRIMAAMVSAMDDAVGDILAEVERLGVTEETCVAFTSDNGPSRESRNFLDGKQEHYFGGTTGGFKGHKFSLYEGGIRVPGMMKWPGVIKPGQVIEEPVASMDIFPTFLNAAGGDLNQYEVDGMDLKQKLSGEESFEERTIFWELGGQTAVRKGDWKLVLNGRLVEGDQPHADVFLSNLNDDPGEQVNLKDKYPEITVELKTLAESWLAGVEHRWETEFSVKDPETV